MVLVLVLYLAQYQYKTVRGTVHGSGTVPVEGYLVQYLVQWCRFIGEASRHASKSGWYSYPEGGNRTVAEGVQLDWGCREEEERAPRTDHGGGRVVTGAS